MLTEEVKIKLKDIWKVYSSGNRTTTDTKGNKIENIDKKRIEAIKVIREIFNDFLTNKTNILEFKTNLDSYNKQNNYWGFTAAKGQMFFNLLAKCSEDDLEKLSDLLKRVIVEPTDLKDGLQKMEELFVYTSKIQSIIGDRRRSANPKSAA